MRSALNWEMSSACGLPLPLSGYQPNMILDARSPAPAWSSYAGRAILDEDRNDSGINSGSECHSSSPGSDHGRDYNPNFTSASALNPYCVTPVTASTSYQPLNLLTPPLLEPKTEHSTPRASPELSQDSNNGDALKKLQLAFDGYLQPNGSPKPSEHSTDDNPSEMGDDFEEDDIKNPKVNSHGKMKTHKCKQCDFVAVTKKDFWEHTKSHIKGEKLLTCPKCPFVTEYKHHLEYHLRNHVGSKPFKCDKCRYSCVNKSMLNSHMKSHSNVYQYRCSNCNYVTKYCHSLKLHLRKYNHKPDMVLNPDGTPNPLPIIDVYGTRRGPKQKPQPLKEENIQKSSPTLDQLMSSSNSPPSQQPPQLQLPFVYPFMGGFPGANPLLIQQMAQVMAARNEMMHENQDDNSRDTATPEEMEERQEEVLDLSKCENSPTRNKRKGPAFKLEQSIPEDDEHEDDEQEDDLVMNLRPEVLMTEGSPSQNENNGRSRERTPERKSDSIEETNNNETSDFTCNFCKMTFGSAIMHTIHMGYHGFKDPFTCNNCGEKCNDEVDFFVHLTRSAHP